MIDYKKKGSFNWDDLRSLIMEITDLNSALSGAEIGLSKSQLLAYPLAKSY